MANETEIKQKKPIWKKWWFWAIAVFVILIIVLPGEDKKEETKPIITPSIQKEIIQPPEEKIIKQEPEKEIVEIGIGVSRKSIIDVFELPALGFSFDRGAPMNGQENYVGGKGTALIQLLGSANNLSEASVMAMLGSDIGENLLSLSVVVGFANIVNSNSTDWVSDEFLKITANPTRSYSNTKVFGKQLFDFAFTPSDFFNILFLVITPAQ